MNPSAVEQHQSIDPDEDGRVECMFSYTYILLSSTSSPLFYARVNIKDVTK